MDVVTITVNRSNEAFDDGEYGNAETARILRKLADSIDVGHDVERPLLDSNGNTVGRVTITE